jgi:hypothetical protein
VESKLKTNILTNIYVKFLLDCISVIENPHNNDEKLINIMRSEIVDVMNLDVITLNREVYKKNYSREGFQLTFWDVLKDIDTDKAEQYHLDDVTYSFETRQESKFRDYKKLLTFRDLIVELHGDIANYGV